MAESPKKSSPLMNNVAPQNDCQWTPGESVWIQGRMLRYGVVGSGPPVVLTHGTPWSSFNLRHLIAALAESYTVYFWDLLGFGDSDQSPGDVSLAAQASTLARLLREWALERPFIIGHDIGGAIVLRAHLRHACDFCRIVLIDPVAVSPWGSPFFRHVRAHEQAFAGLPGYIHEAIVRAYIATAAHAPLDDNVLSATVAPWLGEQGQPAFYRQIAQADTVHTEEVQPFYPSICRPVLILWGREDCWIPLQSGHALANMIPESRLHVIEDAGHLVIEERPQELIAEIQPFLATDDQAHP